LSTGLESEATVSPAVGAAAMKQGYSGVAIIAPSACLPGRLIEGVYAPWAKARDYPSWPSKTTATLSAEHRLADGGLRP